jgi:flavin-dependent dehydrogenase
MNTNPDVFVIGGGPAGLAAAIAARQRGLSVTVADGGEPPIDKPCGEGLLPETLSALTELNISIPTGWGFTFRGIRFVERESELCADFPKGKAIGIRRTLLHDLLIARAEACGVELLWKTPVTGIESTGVKLGDKVVKSRWIVGADGGGSQVRRWGGLGESRGTLRFANRRHYRMKPWTDQLEIYWGENAQAYVTPISEAEICVVVLAERPEKARLAEAWVNWPSLAERLSQAEIVGRDRGAVTSMNSLPKVFRGNVALMGDASGSVDAITGDGLRLAFCQAMALAEAMECGDLRRYQSAHRRLMHRPTWMGRAMLLLGQNGAFRRRAFKSMGARPKLFDQLLAIHTGEFTGSNLLGTGARLGWEFLAAS